jgi:hypothetical protein
MEYRLLWDIKLRVNSKEKALKAYRKIESYLQSENNLITLEKYWKIPELFECKFDEILRANQPEKLVYQTLLKANNIANSWLVTGPDEHEDGLIDFDGVFNNESGTARIQSIEWAHFNLLKHGA